jgi:hypothetical protein
VALTVLLSLAHAAAEQTVSAQVIAPATPTLTTAAQSVAKAPSTVALTITTPVSVIYGEAIDGLAQVTATDGSGVTGTVTFFDGTVSFCTLTLTNGASCPPGSETGFGAGIHVFTAVYSGDATHASSTSNAVTVTVAQDTTTTTLATSANPVPAGTQVIYTAAVAGAHAPAAGTVNFFDGTTQVGSATLTGSGNATLSVLMLSPGDHAITAVYAGDMNSTGSSSSILHETVQSSLAATIATLSANANPALTGDSIAFSAHVALASSAAAIPTGAITFVEGGSALGTATLNPAATATWTTSALTPGTHSIVARYSGDAANAPSISTALTQTINDPAPSGTFTIALDQITIAAGETALIPVKIAGPSSLAKSITLTCSGLPDESSCSTSSVTPASAASSTATLRITTAGPRDCGSSMPYSGSLPYAGPALAFLLVLIPKRSRALKTLLTALFTLTTFATLTGCGTGNCTDLGTRPGTYTITVTGSAQGKQVSQKVKLIVKP